MHAETNYIYIVLAIGYAIYSIIKAGKKVTANRPTVEKQPQQSPTVKPPTSSSGPNPGEEMRKMLEDLLGGSREEEKIPEVQLPKPKPQPVYEKPRPQPVPHHFEHAKPASHSFDKPKSPPVPEKHVAAKPKVVPKKVLVEFESDQEAAPDFDIRKAIIYAEILKRPQY